jgi:hypothetical protein
MPNHSQYDREEEQLDNDLAAGLITPQQHREQMRELQRDYRAAAEESAQDAYDRELGNW